MKNVIESVTIMNAQQILTTMQAVTSQDVLQAKVKELEERVRTLIQAVERVNKCNQRQRESVEKLVKTIQCPSCIRYLDSKVEGDTIEGRKCDNMFLTRCIGILQ